VTATPRKTRAFPGGLHLDGHKSVSTQQPVTRMPLVDEYVLPLSQHIGEASKPVVKVGDQVLKGQRIATARGYISVPLHAPTSGTITAIEKHNIPHPSGLQAECIVLKADGKDTWCKRKPIDDYMVMDRSELRNRIRDAGIVGLGGAGFPSFIKLNAKPDVTVETLILNGAECEPWITCDDMLMREQATAIVTGAGIMAHVLHCAETLIGIEDNKPEAIEALRTAAADTDIQIVTIPTRYPAGGEKQLIYTLTGREVPSNGLPLDIGVICHNVATAAAVYHAIYEGRPLISRIVTVTGPGVESACNFDVLVGTPMQDVLVHAGVSSEQLAEVLMGGPMMGFALHSLDAPVIKTTNCLLASRAEDIPDMEAARPCIRCGQCADACPAVLLPQQLYWYARARNFDKTREYHLFDCIECGCCAYVCPSNIPLVQYYRFAKTEIAQQERDKQQSDKARARHEFREDRLEREKRERAEKRKQRASALKPSSPKQTGEDAKKAAIMAALERAKKKKAANGVQPKNIDHLTPEQQAKIAEVNERRKHLHDADQEDNAS
jgi:electron transport complex protein RnfC